MASGNVAERCSDQRRIIIAFLHAGFEVGNDVFLGLQVVCGVIGSEFLLATLPGFSPNPSDLQTDGAVLAIHIRSMRYSNFLCRSRLEPRLLEEHEQKLGALRQALIDGENSNDVGKLGAPEHR